jgi:S1-C subfamily serine protease
MVQSLTASAGRSVVALKADHAEGRHTHATAVITDAAKGLLLTSNHNVEGAKAVTVTLANGGMVSAKILARAQCEDLALLGMTVRPPGLVGLRPQGASRVRAGDTVVAMGFPADVKDAEHPDRAKLAVTSGMVTMVGANVPVTPMLPALPGVLAHQAPVSPGLSGGPLLATDGTMIGLTVAVGKHDGPVPAINMSFATSAARIAALMAKLTVSKDGEYGGWEDQHECHAAMGALAREVSEADHALGVTQPEQHTEEHMDGEESHG